MWGVASTARLVLAALALLASGAEAHSAPSERLSSIEQRIAADPDNSRLQLQRGHLYRERGELLEALAAYQRAAGDSQLRSAVELARAEVLLQMGAAQAAASLLDQLLARHPKHARALRDRAVARAQMGDHLDAATDFSAAIDAADRPQPDDYLRRGQALVDAGRLNEAVASLDEGIARIGVVPSLVRQALEIELQLGLEAAAGARLAQLAAALHTPAVVQSSWRGDLLWQFGFAYEAGAAYRQAHAELLALPLRRFDPDLELHITQALRRIAHARQETE